jgi:hypothetical protein
VTTDDGGHRETAVAALAERRYEAAGDAYTRAGRRVLADPRPDVDPFADDEQGWVGDGLAHLVTAALAYRVADRSDRATRRAVEGVAVARDLENALSHPAQRACLRAFVADFRVAGGLDGVEAAYAEAADRFDAAAASIDDPRKRATTALFKAAGEPIAQVARGFADGEIAVGWEQLHGSDPDAPGEFLAERARYRRRRFPSLVARAVDDGHLAAPRGTTEYATDRYECPACGSADINRVAGSVLCLRCSRPTEQD